MLNRKYFVFTAVFTLIFGICSAGYSYEVAGEFNEELQSGYYEIIDLGTLGGYNAWSCSVNNAGKVVGAATIHSDPFDPHAFLWSDGVMQDLINGYFGDEQENGIAINDNDVVVGYNLSLIHI